MELWKALGLDMDRHPMVALVGSGGKTTSLYALAREGRQAGRTVIVTTSTHMMPHPGLYLTGSSARESLRGLLGQYGIVTVGEMVKEYKMTGATDLTACKEEADLVLVEADGARLHPLKVPAEHEPVIPPMADAVVAVCGLDCLGLPIGEICHRPEQVAALLGKPLEATVTPGDVVTILLSGGGSRKGVGERPYRVILNKAETPWRQEAGREVGALLAAAGVQSTMTEYTEEERGGLCWF